jgi:hypothetical protein
VRFVVDHVAPGQVFSDIVVFPRQYHSTDVPYSFLHLHVARTRQTSGRRLGTLWAFNQLDALFSSIYFST